ncbi:MAG TPA: alpha/beta hydrolase family protein [Acidimicrobiales bacterium]|nr:alpha/beta hydrolase family protein [Acidimicrobiales bacterium]
MSGPWRILDGPAGALRTYATTGEPGLPPGPKALICHELPRVPGGAPDVGRTFPGLADRLAHESGFQVIVGLLRGAGGSDGDFSAAGWLEDLRFLVEEIAGPGRLWLIGFGLGGALVLNVAAGDRRVAGVATLAAPADLTAWAADGSAVLQRCRRSGAIRTAGFPEDELAWRDELVALRPLEAAAKLGDRPLLVVHGNADDEVPAAAARALADAASPTGPVDLRVVPGAGHWLRADPRVVATLIGWVERQR